MASTAEVELVIQLSVERLWAAVKDSHNLLPKVAPEFVSSVETIEGADGVPGSVRLVNFGSAAPKGAYAKEKLVAVDPAAHEVTTEEIEGGHLDTGYKSFEQTTKLTAAGPDATTIHWTMKYELDEGEPLLSVEESKEGTIKLFKGLEAYILATNSYV